MNTDAGNGPAQRSIAAYMTSNGKHVTLCVGVAGILRAS
jgi:hypothetical protein